MIDRCVMKQPRAIFMVLALVMISGIAWAEEAVLGGSASPKNIKEDNIQVSGSGTFTATSGLKKNSNVLRLVPSVEYFLVDRFSLGASMTYYSVSGQDAEISVGPSATYYFLEFGDWITAIEGGAELGLSDQAYDRFVYAAAGLKYFFNPTVALGPKFFFESLFDSASGSDFQRYGLAAVFSIYL